MWSFLQYLDESAQKLDEEFLKASLVGLRKEAQMFSKNINRIKDGHDLYVVQQAYVKWNAGLENKIYNQILGVHRGVKADETYAVKTLRTKLWDLIIERNIMMVKARYGPDDSAIYASRPTGDHNDHPVYKYNDDNKSLWDGFYERFDKNRKAIYTKYLRLVRAAFDAFDEYLLHQPDTIPNLRHDETITHDGVTVTLFTRDTTSDDPRTEVKLFLDNLSAMLRIVKKMGYGSIVGKCRYNLELSRHGGGGFHAGEYDSGEHKLTIYGLGNSRETGLRTFIHEFGHHVWYVGLNEKQRQAWSDFIEHNLVTFSHEDYRNIHDAFMKAFHKIQSSGIPALNDKLFGAIGGVWENIPAFLTDPVSLELYSAYLRQREGDLRNTNKDNPEVTFARFQKDTEGKPFVVHSPTSYSNENEKESYAEVFMYYGTGRPLTPLIRRVFTTVSGLKTHF